MKPRAALFALALAACGPRPFAILGADLDEALLSVGGTASTDVWTVGADAGDGPRVLSWDGAAWTDHATETTGDLWWVHVEDDVVWMAGDGGRVVRHDRATGAFAEQVLDDAVILFGVWGPGDGTLWAVGGDIVTRTGAALWRYDGTAWGRVAVPEAVAHVALYKVWGRRADDVWICGEEGALLRWQGSTWEVVETANTRTLFTVSGAGDAAYAVGGFGNGAVMRWDGAAWADESPFQAPQLNGVSARGDAVAAVGRFGAVWRRDAGGWAVDPRDPPTDLDLHAVWLDPDGGLWTVGGSLAAQPLDLGVLAYAGPDRPEQLATAGR